MINLLVCGNAGIYNSTADPIKLQEMETSYIKAVFTHPLAFYNIGQMLLLF